MRLDAVAQRLRAVIGLDPECLGSGSLEQVIRLRARALGLSDADAYAERLVHDTGELQCLIDRLLVHETWMFRYPASFHHLEEVAAEFAATAMTRPFRVLSAACATGEEPASIAITLLEAGLPPHQIRVDACDLSRMALERAREGRFPRMSFRGRDPASLLRWLEADGDAWRMRLPVQRLIRYFPANLLAPMSVPESGYDAIFCRNLLIYLTEEAREQVLRNLRKVMAPHGLLYLGHAELGRVQRYGFQAERPVAAFACRPRRARPPAEPAVAKAAQTHPPSARAAATPPRPAAPEEDETKTRATSPPEEAAAIDGSTSADALAEAAALADRGLHTEARRVLESGLQTGAVTASHFHLLAVIHSALRDARAERHALGRALYLDRHHYPSLVQAALRAEEDGDVEKARRFRERAARVHETARRDDRHGRTA